MTKRLGLQWRSMSEEEKAKYRAMAGYDLERYRSEKKDKKSLGIRK